MRTEALHVHMEEVVTVGTMLKDKKQSVQNRERAMLIESKISGGAGMESKTNEMEKISVCGEMIRIKSVLHQLMSG